jgi:hypothetical protein
VKTFDILAPILWLGALLFLSYAVWIAGITFLEWLLGLVLVAAIMYVHYNSKKFQIRGGRAFCTFFFFFLGLPLYAYDLYALKKKQEKELPLTQPPTTDASPVQANVKATEVDSATKANPSIKSCGRL